MMELLKKIFDDANSYSYSNTRKLFHTNKNADE